MDLIPKIPWQQEVVLCYLDSFWKEKHLFFNLFVWTSKLHISQAFPQHQESNSDSICFVHNGL